MAIGKSMHIKVDEGDLINGTSTTRRRRSLILTVETRHPGILNLSLQRLCIHRKPTRPSGTHGSSGNAGSIHAREWEVPEPGSYIIKNIHVLGASIIVTRGTDGVIRCFHDICPHRGNQLFDPTNGPARGVSAR